MPVIGDIVKSNRTGFLYTFEGWDEDTIDGQMVAQVMRQGGTQPFPVLWNDSWSVHNPPIVVNGVEFRRDGITSMGTKVLQEHYFATDNSRIHITVDYEFSQKGYK